MTRGGNRASFRALGVVAGLLIGIPISQEASAAEMDHIFTFFLAEKFEYRVSDGQDSFDWDAQGWVGGDDDKVWFKTEGQKPTGAKLERAEVQLLYSRRISDFFDAQVGARYDFQPRPERSFAIAGVQGLAPYFFEIDTAVFVSEEGELSARLEGEYDLLITQRLILQPNLEVNLAAQSVEERGIGSGVNDIELGLRLRYEVEREFAPYVGVNWERKLAKTADFAKRDGKDTSTLSFVAGIRLWF